MLDTQRIIEIISGQRNDPLDRLIRCGLGCLTPIYRLAVCWRNQRFDRAINRGNSSLIRHVSVPVISIGNLTTGGTGKTPLVIWIARLLREQGSRVAIVSRGYRAIEKSPHLQRNDEAIEMEFRLPDVPHLQDPDRHLMAEIAVQEYGADVILIDDGFQHRRLHRDLDIVLIDATNPFGFDRLLPRGLLREPVSNLRRADIIVCTRCDQISDAARLSLNRRLIAANTSALHLLTCFVPKFWLQFDGQQFPLEQLAGRPTYAFCGIGNPEGFRQTLHQISVEIKGMKIFADHHDYTNVDLEQMATSAKHAGAEAIICTHKDLVKVKNNQIGGLPVYALLIELEFMTGQDKFEQEILGRQNSGRNS